MNYPLNRGLRLPPARLMLVPFTGEGMGRNVRKIIHVDVVGFYAAVEQQHRSELRGCPVVVGGTPEAHGLVASVSKEARAYGIRPAMTCVRARDLCPDVSFVRPDFPKYRAASERIRSVFEQVTDSIEFLGMGQAFLDVSDCTRSAGQLAMHLKTLVREQTGLRASVGVGPNRLVAKMASEAGGLEEVLVVPPAMVDAFLGPLPITRLWGVGRNIVIRMRKLGIRTFDDLRRLGEARLSRLFQGEGQEVVDWACGNDEASVPSPAFLKGARPIRSRASSARDLGVNVIRLPRIRVEPVTASTDDSPDQMVQWSNAATPI